MTVTYQVAGGGHLDIDFKLTGPGGRVMNEQRKRDTGTYSFTAESDGRYTYCFSNEMSTVSGKTVRCVCLPGLECAEMPTDPENILQFQRPRRHVCRRRW